MNSESRVLSSSDSNKRDEQHHHSSSQARGMNGTTGLDLLASLTYLPASSAELLDASAPRINDKKKLHSKNAKEDQNPPSIRLFADSHDHNRW